MSVNSSVFQPHLLQRDSGFQTASPSLSSTHIIPCINTSFPPWSWNPGLPPPGVDMIPSPHTQLCTLTPGSPVLLSDSAQHLGKPPCTFCWGICLQRIYTSLRLLRGKRSGPLVGEAGLERGWFLPQISGVLMLRHQQPQGSEAGNGLVSEGGTPRSSRRGPFSSFLAGGGQPGCPWQQRACPLVRVLIGSHRLAGLGETTLTSNPLAVPSPPP